MNRKHQQVLSTTQQNKLWQLQLEIEALEKHIDNILEEQVRSNPRGISPIYLRDRTANAGIKLAHDI